ncbi:hypothetical protein [Nocardia brasiliensis]|uniref:hypothetical protein n=1 Tax=Nocardia brasiliensis TaxID=37326 RepID=UPI0018953438|nr:hypothetical protein [Nocardia brasiliensis]MBF6544860.1 hypothetical protein [Nocardia brasiliensis]
MKRMIGSAAAAGVAVSLIFTGVAGAVQPGPGTAPGAQGGAQVSPQGGTAQGGAQAPGAGANGGAQVGPDGGGAQGGAQLPDPSQLLDGLPGSDLLNGLPGMGGNGGAALPGMPDLKLPF